MFRALIDASPVIPAMRSAAQIDAAIASPSRVVYLLFGSVLSVPALIDAVQRGGKSALVNIDLIDGLRGDPAAVDYLCERGVDGVISTHADVLRTARSRRICAVQRSFLLDSAALANAVRALDRFEPDAVELLPAVAAPRAVAALHRTHPDIVVTGGGLVGNLAEIDALVRAGVSAVSVSNQALWIA